MKQYPAVLFNLAHVRISGVAMFLACNLSQTFFDSVGVSLPQGSASLQLSSKQNEDGIAKVMVGEKVPISPKHQAQNNGNSFKYSSFYSNEVNTFM